MKKQTLKPLYSSEGAARVAYLRKGQTQLGDHDVGTGQTRVREKNTKRRKKRTALG